MIEIFCDVSGKWRFRIKGGNGEIVASSEGYSSRSNAARGVQDLRAILKDTEGDVKRDASLEKFG